MNSLVVLVGIVLLKCSNRSSSRIYQGQQVRPDDPLNFPYHVQLTFYNRPPFCGGTLIHPRYSISQKKKLQRNKWVAITMRQKLSLCLGSYSIVEILQKEVSGNHHASNIKLLIGLATLLTTCAKVLKLTGFSAGCSQQPTASKMKLTVTSCRMIMILSSLLGDSFMLTIEICRSLQEQSFGLPIPSFVQKQHLLSLLCQVRMFFHNQLVLQVFFL